jgi:hypothetical protein
LFLLFIIHLWWQAISMMNPFEFIAFSQDSQAMLGHGSYAAKALDLADRAAPDDNLIVLRAGGFGDLLWTTKLPLDQALSITAPVSSSS